MSQEVSYEEIREIRSLSPDEQTKRMKEHSQGRAIGIGLSGGSAAAVVGWVGIAHGREIFAHLASKKAINFEVLNDALNRLNPTETIVIGILIMITAGFGMMAWSEHDKLHRFKRARYERWGALCHGFCSRKQKCL